ncbi:MAG TPA: DUF1598 domain-containing protein [Pirellulaceae bacterium]|nr:DUF1598 domain-containing protein [Pirellulaceae bacterium]
MRRLFSVVTATSRFAGLLAILGFCLVFCWAPCSVSCAGSNEHVLSSNRIQAHIDAGEYALALDLVRQLPDRVEADRWYQTIAAEQASHGARRGALRTIGFMDDNRQRHSAFERLALGANASGGSQRDDNRSNDNDGNQRNTVGNRGGITEADFDDLIELIQEIIFPDSWEDNGGTGRIRPFAAGVHVDSSGVLSRIEGNLLKDWNSLRRVAPNIDWQLDRSIDLSKISLNRLEAEIMKLKAQGKTLSDEIKYLGGIYEVQYIMVIPESNDLVIAGPAGPWKFDRGGRGVNVATGRPVLLLDDLVVCLRNAWEGNGVFGCSIDPRQENLAKVQEFQQTSKLVGDAKMSRLRELMGLQDITVHGIDPRTHAGQVIVEADYRMKLIAMGLEETIHQVPSYLDRITYDEQGNVPPVDLLRLWFTMNYDGISASPDGQVFQLLGQAVKVQSESEFLGERGERVQTGQASGPAKTFAADFTRNYTELSKKYAIYGELKNVFDLSLAANLIHRFGLADRVGWTPTYFASPTSLHAFNYQVPLEAHPVTVMSVVNDRTLRQTIGSKRLNHHIIGVSGGVDFDVNPVLRRVKSDEVLDDLKMQSSSGQTSKWHWE